MDTQTLYNFLQNYAKKYAEDGIVISIKRSNHMNEISEDSKIDDSDAVKILNEFISFCKKQKISTVNDRIIPVLEILTETAKEFIKEDNNILLEAIVVDFINFVGVKHCVDYALYTSDLKP